MQQSEQPVGILLIATNKYKEFVPQFIESASEFFMKSKKLNIYLFTDGDIPGLFIISERVNIFKITIPSYKFPFATLYRYKIFLKDPIWEECSHIFYFDVDMRIVSPIGDEMLASLVAVRHPGFDKMGGGSWERNRLSANYTEYCENYYAGGVQGGEMKTFKAAMQQMEWRIDIDIKNGLMPVWHDEAAWNCFLSRHGRFSALDSSYCMVEQPSLRKKWKIDRLEPKVIALEKDHALMRK